MQLNLTHFCNEKLWLMRSRDLPFHRRFLLTTARVVVLTSRRFVQNNCTLKASALTFYTLFSIVPILALIFGIAKGLGLAQILDEKIRTAAADYPAVAEKIIHFSDSMLQSAKGGVVAGVGVLLLIWSAVKLLGSIETNMNEIWGVRHGRSLIRKITDYVAILIICPVLLLAAGSSVVFAAAQVDKVINTLPGAAHFGTVVRMGHSALPLLITWLVFTFIYTAIPNTKVKILPALTAGLITACAYTLLQSFYVFAQFTTSKFNAIYGSFAALPLFLTWLNLSWILIMAGSQLTFSIQNVSEYEMQPVDSELSQLQRHVYAIEIAAVLIRKFRQCGGTMSDEEISVRLELPIRMVRALLYDLVRCGIITPAAPMENQRSARHYLIAMPPEKITVKQLLLSLDELDSSKYMNDRARLYLEKYRKIQDSLDQTPANLPVDELSRDFPLEREG